MGKLYTILFAFLFFIPATAQTFRVDSESKVYGSIGTELKHTISIKNITGRPVQLHIERIDSQIGSGQSTYFCWGADCLKENEKLFLGALTIDAGMTSNRLGSVLKTGLVETSSTVRYLIYDIKNPADSIIHEISYSITDPTTRAFLLNNKDIKISNLYPNPVNNYAIFDYSFNNRNSKAKIILHNVLGGIVGEFDLTPFENKLKITTSELNPGVYFYTLQLDNDNLITKKMVIRRD